MDSSSIILAQLITLTVFSIAFGSLAWSGLRVSYCARWASASIVLTAGLGLVMAGSFVQGPLFYLLVNTCFISGLTLLRQGAAEFHGIKLSFPWSWLPAAVVVATTLLINLGVTPALSYLVFNLAAFWLVFDTTRIYLINRNDGLRSRWGLAFSYGLLCVSLSLRIGLGAADLLGIDPHIGGTWVASLHLGLVLVFVSANGAFSLALVFEEMAAEHRAAAFKDPLTGVFNRREFFNRLDTLLETRPRTPFAVIQLDMDHFKQINDRFGHGAGDLVLQLSTRTMQAELADIDCLARIGGEEFAILMPEVSYEKALHKADAIRAAIEALQLPFEKESPRLTLSAGLFHGRGSGLTGDQIMEIADRKLYEAKHGGRNRIRIAEVEAA